MTSGKVTVPAPAESRRAKEAAAASSALFPSSLFTFKDDFKR